MTLTADVTEIAKETQRIEDELFKKPSEQPPVTPPVTPPPPAEKPSEEPAPIEKPVEPPPETPPVEPPPEPVTPPETPTPPPEDFEHKYKVLQGKYNKEIKDLRGELKQTVDKALTSEYERDELLKQISGLTSRLEKLEKGEEKPKEQVSEDLDKEPEVAYIKEQFPDVYKAMKKFVTKSVEHAVGDTRSRVESVEKKVESVSMDSARSAKLSFDQYLDQNVQGWRKVNVDPKFKEWLSEVEEYTGQPKITLIKEAISKLDAPTVARFFTNFATENQVEDVPPVTPNPHPIPKPSTPSLTPPKSRQVAPPTRPAGQETITTDYITEFYDKVRRGFYKGRESEAQAEEKRIENAVAEGRVK